MHIHNNQNCLTVYKTSNEHALTTQFNPKISFSSVILVASTTANLGYRPDVKGITLAVHFCFYFLRPPNLSQNYTLEGLYDFPHKILYFFVTLCSVRMYRKQFQQLAFVFSFLGLRSSHNITFRGSKPVLWERNQASVPSNHILHVIF